MTTVATVQPNVQPVCDIRRELSRVTGVLHPDDICHFGDESFQAIYCTETDNHKQRNKITRAPEKHKNDQIQKT